MQGAIPPSIVVEAIAIMAWRCVIFLAPVLAITALWWLVNRTDRMMNYFFPDLEWEKNLGWLNISAERRANTALRWLGYGIYLVLGGALYGIAWAAAGMQDWDRASTDPAVVADLLVHVPVLMACLGAWVLYLGTWLIPKLRTEREEAQLRRFRVEMEEVEQQRERNPRSRVKSPLRKPRTNQPLAMPQGQGPLGAGRSRYWREPGG
jgi:hypothetical protein